MRRVGAVAVVAAALVLAGCVRVTHADGSTFCGTHINTGAKEVLFTPLDPAVPAPPGGAPKASVLPAASTSGGGFIDYVRTGPDCSHGAVVSVTPVDGARLVRSFAGPHGGVIGVILETVSGTVQVSGWVDGRYLGGLQLHG